MALVYTGWELVSRSRDGKYPQAVEAHVGWAILLICVVVLVATVDRWVRFLQVFLGGGILGSLLALGSGHLLNGKPFPRPVSAILTTLLIGCSLILQTLAKRKLEVVDRVALIAFVAAFVGGMLVETPTSGVIGLGTGFAILLALWLHHRSSSGKDEPSQITNRGAVPPIRDGE
jgi:hypothetical protein